MMPKDDGIGLYNCLRVVLDEGVAAIVVHRRTDVESLNPRKSHDRRVAPLACAMIRHPGGPIGVASKLNGPFINS